jgi:hypothetical protein
LYVDEDLAVNSTIGRLKIIGKALKFNPLMGGSLEIG